MSRRTLAALIAVACLGALWTAAVVMPVPYVTYRPGLSVDVLAEQNGQEIVQVSGHKVYRDNGELRMTTIYLTRPDAKVNIFDALQAWISRDDAIYPRSAIYAEGETSEDADNESAREMVSSQDNATAAALRALGYQVQETVDVESVTPGAPADGKLKIGDVITEVDGRPLHSRRDLVKQIQATPPGGQVTLLLHRGSRQLSVQLTPTEVTDSLGTRPMIGIAPGVSDYDFPFSVSIKIPEQIGGPSAGLMFSLAIYDTLTPGSLTGGMIVAGTGTIDSDGTVGEIGGIQQKIVTAQHAHAGMFLVPPVNCKEALGAPDSGMRLVKATTMESAMKSIKAWVQDPNAPLPSCEDQT
jgi:PDZ domain-containing protein